MILVNLNKLVLFILMLLNLQHADVWSQEIYRWVDKDGNEHFTTKSSDRASPVKLPEIAKFKMNEDITKYQTCDRHGGVNCQAGADHDGSVICFDGFKEVTTRFSYHCSTARIKIAKVVYDNSLKVISVFIQNKKPVAAQNVEIYYMYRGAKQSLEGATKIDPYGVEEFRIVVDPKQGTDLKEFRSKLRLICSNCE